jgi:uncharacterized DUF497 family protein
MKTTFDPAKDVINKRKHGISLSRAKDFDFDAAMYDLDDSQDYGEIRHQAVSFLDGRMYSLVFVLDGEKIRAINLRKATKREQKNYEES